MHSLHNFWLTYSLKFHSTQNKDDFERESLLKKTDDFQPDDESNKAGDESFQGNGSKVTDDAEEDDDETDPVV